MVTEEDNIEPCCTLYVRNLDEKVKKDELRKLLHAAFSPHGRVVSIVALKTLKMRGQAFVSFDDVATATKAKQAMQNFDFNGKPMVIQYAKQVSDKALVGEGAASQAKKRRKVEKAKRNQAAMDRADKKEGERAGLNQMEQGKGTGDTMALVGERKDPGPPNRTLFVEGLPIQGALQTKNTLTELFNRFAGFVEVRTVPGKDGIAFVEFQSEAEAAVAMSGLQGYKLGSYSQAMVITYAKK